MAIKGYKWLFRPGSPLRLAIKGGQALAYAGGYSRRRNLGQNLGPTPAPDVIQKLKQDGFARIDGMKLEFMSELVPDSVRRLAAVTPKVSTTRPKYGALLTAEDLSPDSLAMRFLTQDAVMRTVTEYFGYVPYLAEIAFVHSNVSHTEPDESQLWHRDYDDTKMLKLFVYLTDVEGTEDGPFTFLPAGPSKKVPNSFFPRRIRDDEIAALGLDKQVTEVIGPKLTGFFVDTHRCYHFGSRCRRNSRLAMVATFTSPCQLWRWDNGIKLADASFSGAKQALVTKTF